MYITCSLPTGICSYYGIMTTNYKQNHNGNNPLNMVKNLQAEETSDHQLTIMGHEITYHYLTMREQLAVYQLAHPYTDDQDAHFLSLMTATLALSVNTIDGNPWNTQQPISKDRTGMYKTMYEKACNFLPTFITHYYEAYINASNTYDEKLLKLGE